MSCKDCIHINICPDELFFRGCDTCKFYELERVCSNNARKWNCNLRFEAYSFVCSKCGYNEPKKDVDNALCLSIFDVKYCRNCGAKVVSE